MMIEEMAELTLAIQHFKRRRVPIENVIEEIADVELMFAMKVERTWRRLKISALDVFDKYNKVC